MNTFIKNVHNSELLDARVGDVCTGDEGDEYTIMQISEGHFIVQRQSDNEVITFNPSNMTLKLRPFHPEDPIEEKTPDGGWQAVGRDNDEYYMTLITDPDGREIRHANALWR